MATVSLKQSENVLSLASHKVAYPCGKYAPVFSTIFAGMENSFSVSLCKRLVGNIWIILPDGPKGSWFRGMGLHWSACSGSPQPLLLDKETSFLISLRSIQRVKQECDQIWEKPDLKLQEGQNEFFITLCERFLKGMHFYLP